MHWSKEESRPCSSSTFTLLHKKKEKAMPQQHRSRQRKRGRKKFANIYQRHCETS
jgi:hypothetical protein